MNNKNLSIISFLLAGLILIGLLSSWNYNTWRYVDFVVIVVSIFIGVTLINQNDLKLINIIAILQSKKFRFIVLILIGISILSCCAYFVIDKIKKENLECKFNISNIVENRYQEDKEEGYIFCTPPKKLESYQGIDFIQMAQRLGLGCPTNGKIFEPARHYTYWEIDGMIKNNSKNNQYLKSVVLKIYTNDERKILLAEDYLDIKELLTPSQSYPFQVRTEINRDSQMGKYFHKNDKVKIDMYPYFGSCSY